LLSLCCGRDAAQTEQSEDSRSGDFHDGLLNGRNYVVYELLVVRESSLIFLLAARSKLLQVGPQV
jgi:hypothetical protein